MTRNGFTLIELLAALAVGSLLLAAVGYMTGLFGDRLKRIRQDGGFEQIAGAAPTLVSLIEQANSTFDTRRQFSGDDRHLSVEIAPPLALGPVGPMRLDLAVARGADGAALDITLSPINERPLQGFPQRRRLVHGLRAIQLRYLGDDEVLPQLITIAFQTRTGETWDLAIEPKARASATCHFDPISLTCRQ